MRCAARHCQGFKGCDKRWAFGLVSKRPHSPSECLQVMPSLSGCWLQLPAKVGPGKRSDGWRLWHLGCHMGDLDWVPLCIFDLTRSWWCHSLGEWPSGSQFCLSLECQRNKIFKWVTTPLYSLKSSLWGHKQGNPDKLTQARPSPLRFHSFSVPDPVCQWDESGTQPNPGLSPLPPSR